MKIILTVDAYIHFDYKKLSKDDYPCQQEILKKFTKRNPKIWQLQKLGYSIRGVPYKIRSYFFKSDEIFIYRGGYKKLRKIFKEFGHKVLTRDHRLSFPPIPFASNIKLRKEQVAPIEIILDKEQGLIRGECSSGKTIILLEAIARAKQPACVVVWNTTHQKQWIRAALDPKLLNLRKADIGGIGGVFPKPKLAKLNICMQQSLFNLAKRDALGFFSDHCGFLGCDEVQRFAASTFQNVVNDFPAKYRVGVSASERRRDGCQFLIYDSFGKVIHKIVDTSGGSRIPAKIYLVTTRFLDENYDGATDRVSMITNMIQDAERNKLILNMVRRSVAKRKMCLILTERKEHAVRLKFSLSNLRTGFLMGGSTKDEIEEMGLDDQAKKYMLGLNLQSEEDRVIDLIQCDRFITVCC